jgi:hypothetical protein
VEIENPSAQNMIAKLELFELKPEINIQESCVQFSFSSRTAVFTNLPPAGKIQSRNSREAMKRAFD